LRQAFDKGGAGGVHERGVARQIQHDHEDHGLGRSPDANHGRGRAVDRRPESRSVERRVLVGRSHAKHRTGGPERFSPLCAKRNGEKDEKEAHQKLNLIPSWITLPPREPMMRPAFTFGAEAGPMTVSGSVQLPVFVKLNPVAVTSIELSFESAIRFVTERS
jgi:hypothetical protein